MKSKFYVILLIVLLKFFSACSVRQNVFIPYILGLEAEQSIYQAIEHNEKNISFYFESLLGKKYKVHLYDRKDIFSSSQRKLFINDKFYPIVFDTDYKFYVKLQNNFPTIRKFENYEERKSNYVRIPSIEERLKDNSLYLKDVITNNIDWSTYWIVNEDGDLLETNSK